MDDLTEVMGLDWLILMFLERKFHNLHGVAATFSEKTGFTIEQFMARIDFLINRGAVKMTNPKGVFRFESLFIMGDEELPNGMYEMAQYVGVLHGKKI